jgi:hypothetical protein
VQEVLGSNHLSHVQDEDESVQCAIFRLLLLERVTCFLSTSFCMVADDGVTPDGDAHPMVMIVARR